VTGRVRESLHFLQSGVQHIHAHNHALAPAERGVIHGAMAAESLFADVMDVEIEEAVFAGALDD